MAARFLIQNRPARLRDYLSACFENSAHLVFRIDVFGVRLRMANLNGGFLFFKFRQKLREKPHIYHFADNLFFFGHSRKVRPFQRRQKCIVGLFGNLRVVDNGFILQNFRKRSLVKSRRDFSEVFKNRNVFHDCGKFLCFLGRDITALRSRIGNDLVLLIKALHKL